MSGPKGNLSLSGGNGFFQADLPGAATSSPGTYTFTASGGKDIKGFTVAVNVSAPLTITNRPALATVTRTQDTVVTWSGGFPSGDVQVEGEVGGKFGTVRFFCHAPSSAGQLTVPASILAGMATGSGALVVTNVTAPQSISASGLDFGNAVVTVGTNVNTTFK